MRIALVITELDPGGAEQCLTELAIFLAAKGHGVGVWSLGARPRAGQEALVERLSTAGINVHFGNAQATVQAVGVVRWLRRELALFQPDIVQSMLWHANVMSALALWSRRVPLVGGMRVSEPRRGRWWIERIAARRMQRMICVSRDVQQHARDKQRIADDKLVVIPNGVHAHWLEPDVAGNWSELGLNASSSKLLFVGRLEQQKGVLELADHLPELLSSLPGWSMVLLGQGSLQSEVERQVAAAGLSDRVHLVGWQPRAPRWMAASELLILPASYEGMPNVLLENMAVGRPFVSFAVDGTEQLLDTADGYPRELALQQLAPCGNWSEFTRRVHALANDPDMRQRCGAANRGRIVSHFRLEAQLAKYETLYANLVRPANTTVQGPGY